MPSPSVIPLETQHDPVRRIRELQRSQQRFWPGLAATIVVAPLVAWLWSHHASAFSAGSRLAMVVAMVGAAAMGLLMRLIGRVSELRLALGAGAVATLAFALGDYLARAGVGGILPQGQWLQLVGLHVAVCLVATVIARNELDIELSKPAARRHGGAVAVPALAAFEDGNAVVLEEPANVQRGVITVPGKLVLTRRHLSFTERLAGRLTHLVALTDVVEADRGVLPKSFRVTLRDGSKLAFAVLDRDKWIVQVNARVH